MEKHSEQKQEGWGVTFTSTAEELLLKQCEAESEERSHKRYTEEQREPSEGEDKIQCEKCHSSDIETWWVSGQHLLHCICRKCAYEWVE